MKNITFIALVSLSLTVAASAVQNNNQNTDGVYTLPAYKVTTTRFTDAEKTIQANLAELRAQAATPMQVRTELPSLGTVAQPAQTDQGRSVPVKPVTAGQARS